CAASPKDRIKGRQSVISARQVYGLLKNEPTAHQKTSDRRLNTRIRQRFGNDFRANACGVAQRNDNPWLMHVVSPSFAGSICRQDTIGDDYNTAGEKKKRFLKKDEKRMT